jgi:prepilin-type N-terminal cleavage/methylation domain-containing protein
MRTPSTTHPVKPLGFSMPEMVVTISIIGVLAAIIVVSMSDMVGNGKVVLAYQRMEMLNSGLNQMAMNGRQIATAPQLTSALDENLVVMTLQMRNEMLVGSPYVVPTYLPKASSDGTTFRLRFTGHRFELLLPGQAGTGLKVEFDGSDMGPARVFPANFRPYGS